MYDTMRKETILKQFCDLQKIKYRESINQFYIVIDRKQYTAKTRRDLIDKLFEKYCGDALCQKTVTIDFFTHKSVKNNVVLADSIGETDPNRVIIVELTKNTALRRDVNLFDNPQNLNKRLTVKGMLIDYKETSYHGCMETLSDYREDEDYYFLLE